jgi:hypothetical protein
MQHLTEVLVEGRVHRDVTPAHRRGKGDQPACMSSSTGRWVQLSAGRALELGAVPCKAAACVGVAA